ncbi:MAG: hypothetical protein ISR64_08365 [Deltaproteobacteria bacterium]|nr:hypothetical protein [Deltaproteobacteria bacterium]
MRSTPVFPKALPVIVVSLSLVRPVTASPESTGPEDWRRAVELLDAALTDGQKQEAANRVSRIEAALCETHDRMTLTVDPADADVWIGRKEPGARFAGDTAWLTPGRHRIFAQGRKPPGTSVVVQVRVT